MTFDELVLSWESFKFLIKIRDTGSSNTSYSFDSANLTSAA